MRIENPYSVPVLSMALSNNFDHQCARGLQVYRLLELGGLLKMGSVTRIEDSGFANPTLQIASMTVLTEAFADQLEDLGPHRPWIVVVDYTTNTLNHLEESTWLVDGEKVAPPEHVADGSFARTLQRILPLADAITCSYECAVKPLRKINKRTFYVPDVQEANRASRATFLRKINKVLDGARLHHHRSYRRLSDGKRPERKVLREAPGVRAEQYLAWEKFADRLGMEALFSA